MKNSILRLTLFVAAAVFSPLRADAQSTYTTTNGTVNLLAGLTNLSIATAINTTNQATGISYITDSSWSTGIANLGTSSPNLSPNNGTLAGSFGGGTYFASLHSIILIGVGGANSGWGGWTLRLLLSNDTYSSPISYTDGNLVANLTVTTATDTEFFESRTGTTFAPGAAPTYYQMVDIAAFDTGNIGVKGLEMSGLTEPYPDIAYIGVTDYVIPEPSTYALLALSAAGLGGYILRRRRK